MYFSYFVSALFKLYLIIRKTRIQDQILYWHEITDAEYGTYIYVYHWTLIKTWSNRHYLFCCEIAAFKMQTLISYFANKEFIYKLIVAK